MLILYETRPYLNTLQNSNLSQDITELYLILIHHRKIPYISTLPIFTLSWNITELYHILILPNYTLS